MNIDLYNKNLEACLKGVYKIGSTEFRNICDGTTHTIPWGSLDWLAVIIAFIIAIGFMFMVIKMALGRS